MPEPVFMETVISPGESSMVEQKMVLSRRGVLLGIGAALAAPAIVRFESIMPVRNRLIAPDQLWIQSVLRVAWERGGKPELIVCGPNAFKEFAKQAGFDPLELQVA